ncbi:MAG: transposase [Patescibacteria group bacterium]
MSLRNTPFVADEYYHLYNRGNSKQKIFHDKQDYKRFLLLLHLVNTKEKIVSRLIKEKPFSRHNTMCLVGIGAYCLMPNHFHLIVKECGEGGISKFMQKLTTAYAMYYNQKYKRSGSLFEGKFKSQHTESDKYLKYLFSYIHLNPLKLIDKDWRNKRTKDKKWFLDFLRTYHYSSYRDYIFIVRPENIILNKEIFPAYFPNEELFEKEVFEWLSYGE